MKNVLCVASHPDDEVLGCGGALARHVAEGDEVHVLWLCDNGTGTANEKAVAALGVKHWRHWFQKDQRLDQLPFHEVEHVVRQRVKQVQPQLVYTHWQGDLNRDHRITAEAVHLATRPKDGKPIEVCEFYTASSTEYTTPLNFVPDTWVNIGLWLPLKQAAMACYETELQQPYLPRNEEGVRTVARFWGMQVGLLYAEVFRTARRIL